MSDQNWVSTLCVQAVEGGDILGGLHTPPWKNVIFGFEDKAG